MPLVKVQSEVMPLGRRLEECPKAWYDASFGDERSLLDAVYGQIFGGPAIDYLHTSILKWAEVKASELDSNVKLKPTDVALDLGCGPGFVARAVAKRVATVYCWDVNADMHNYARMKHGNALQYGLTTRADITKSPLSGLPDNSLDVFYAYAVFIHHDLYTFVSYFTELARKMRLNGRVYLEFLPGESFDPADPTFREHYNIWANKPKFWTMAMHWNSKRSVIQIARMYGFQQVRPEGHAGKSHPSDLDGPNRPQKEFNGNILFTKVMQYTGTPLHHDPVTRGMGRIV